VSLAVVGLALAACGGEAVTSSTSQAATSQPAATVAPSPTPAAARFAFDGEEPTVTRELAGSTETFINPGAVIEADDGTLHMFANVFTAFAGSVAIPHLTSSDGIAWTLAEQEPILTVDDIPLARPGFDVSTGYVGDDGSWVLIFMTVNQNEPPMLGRATAPGPDGPWTVDPGPILEAGPEGSIDAGGLTWPSVIRTDAGYFMYYTAGKAPPTDGVIAVATSADGQVWEKHDEPVLVADQDWEFGKLDRPRAVVTPRGIAMVYSGRQLTDRGLAWSDDGLTWQKDGGAPVISAATFPVTGGAWDAALILRDEELVYYLEIGGGTPTTGTQVYRAVMSLP
jgi:hypothetical protein